jgi:hypothetical protein
VAFDATLRMADSPAVEATVVAAEQATHNASFRTALSSTGEPSNWTTVLSADWAAFEVAQWATDLQPYELAHYAALDSAVAITF